VRIGKILLVGLSVAALLSLLGLLGQPAAALDVPYLAGPVNDQAQMIPPDAEARIAEKIAAFRTQTGNQVTVLTLPSLEGEAVEDFSMRVAEQWKLGEKDKDNGVLFLISRDDRKMRIEVGYGLEPELTDLESGRILSDLVVPAFKGGDFGGGVEKGVDAIVTSLSGGEVDFPAKPAVQPMPLGPKVAAMGLFAVVVGVFSLLAISLRGGQSWFLYLFLMPFYLLFPMIIAPIVGVIAWLAWTVAFPILHTLAMKRGWGRNFAGGSVSNAAILHGILGGGGRRGGGWGSGGGGWGGSGGGGWSGGGGSFGGGGASSSW
jgi:uncharacterized protein